MTGQDGFWRDGARLAVSVSMQFEAGGQPVSGAGGPITEQILPGCRDLGQNSFYEYGAREGVSRILDLLDAHGIKMTSFMIGDAVRQHPESTAAPPRSADCLGGVPESRTRHVPRMLAARKEDNVEGPRLEYTAELLRHFADLRDGTHGGAVRRQDKERYFSAAVALLDSHARQALNEINTDLLLCTGEVTASGVRRHGGGVEATWSLSWPEQRAAGISPIAIRAYYSTGAHHPHLRGGTVGDWPLNVFDDKQAAAELPTLRAVASADLHNLVFQRDYRIIPAIVKGWTPARSARNLPGTRH